jgi:heavy metal sensor kinase
MTARMSIRLRLTLWYSAVLLAGLALFGGGMWLALEHRLMAQVDTRLEQRVDGLRAALNIEGGHAGREQLQEELSEFIREVPEGGFIQLSDARGSLLPPSPPEGDFTMTPGGDSTVFSTVTRNGRPYRILTTRIRDGANNYQVLVATSLEDTSMVMRDFRALLLFMAPTVLLMACFGGYWISGRALAPVDEITRVARSISVQNLSRRLAIPRTGDEIQRMSETWNEVLERLDSAVKRIRQFTADASHELRTPLALIRATAELALRRERQPEEYQRWLREIQTEAERMTELTESLLALARADSGAGMPLSKTDLNQVVQQVVGASAAAAESKGIVLRADTAAGAAVAQANESAIRRLLLTLIDNALKHTPSGGTVTVSTALAGDGVTLAVRDTGEGIPPAALPHVFERFFRADTARGSGSGVGLGLSIAQAIAQAHGSQIVVESEPGSGARFALLLRS